MTPDPSPSPTRLMIPSPGPNTWDVIAQWVAIGLLTTGTFIFIVFVVENLLSSDKKREIKPFYLWIAAIAFFGGLLSFFLPIAINSGFNKDDDGSQLRQALLYTTGGLLGVITLGETHRKNDQEKKKNEQEKEKNDQDHIRQVHAERRSRYTKAIEQLANDKAAIRLGGIYTLVGLVDEWLTDTKTLPDKEKREEEGQVIVNNLCAYIRSHFLWLKSKNTSTKKILNITIAPYSATHSSEKSKKCDELSLLRSQNALKKLIAPINTKILKKNLSLGPNSASISIRHQFFIN